MARILVSRCRRRLRRGTQNAGREIGTNVPASVAGPRHSAITREHDGLRTRAHAQLVEYRREVIAHGLLADEERRGDSRIALAFGHELEDLAFARGEPGEVFTLGGSVGGAS